MSAPGLDQARALLARGRFKPADALLRRLLRERVVTAELRHLAGLARLGLGDTDGAIEHLSAAVAAEPIDPAIRSDLAEANFRAGRFDLAEGECQIAMRLDPGAHQPRNLLGVIALRRNDPVTALRCFAEALAAHPGHPGTLTNAAGALVRLGQFERAADWCRQALATQPGHHGAQINLGLAMKGLGRRTEARAAFEAAAALPMARFNLGYLDLVGDDLEHGLPACEERKAMLGIGRGLGHPEWDGRPRPDRTLLVIHEQGLGDTILMCRFFSRLTPLFGRVIVQVQEPLVRLMGRLPGGFQIVTGRAGVDFDSWCATMSLPLKLGLRSAADIPNDPWLAGPNTPARRRPDGPLKVGINWAGNPSFAADATRSTSLDSFALLFQAPGVEWVSLHRGHREADAERFGLPQPLRDARDFEDTARVVETLDLVVSTETAVPNLSAAMGIPTLVLAAIDHDWRWRSWYPGVRVLAQERPGDWSSPVLGVLEQLAERLPAAA